MLHGEIFIKPVNFIDLKRKGDNMKKILSILLSIVIVLGVLAPMADALASDTENSNTLANSFIADWTKTDDWTGDTVAIRDGGCWIHTSLMGFSSRGRGEAQDEITTVESYDFGTKVAAEFNLHYCGANASYYTAAGLQQEGTDYIVSIGDFDIYICDFQTRVKVLYKDNEVSGTSSCSDYTYINEGLNRTFKIAINKDKITVTSYNSAGNAIVSYEGAIVGFEPVNNAKVTIKRNETWHISASAMTSLSVVSEAQEEPEPELPDVPARKTVLNADLTSAEKWTGDTAAIGGNCYYHNEKVGFSSRGRGEAQDEITTVESYDFGNIVSAEFSLHYCGANASYYTAAGLQQAGTDYIVSIGDFDIKICDYQTRVSVLYKGEELSGTSSCSDYKYYSSFDRTFKIAINQNKITVTSYNSAGNSIVSYEGTIVGFEPLNNAKVTVKRNETWHISASVMTSLSVMAVKTSMTADFTTTAGWSGDISAINTAEGKGWFGSEPNFNGNNSDGWDNTSATIQSSDVVSLGKNVEAEFSIYTFYGNQDKNNSGRDFTITMGKLEIAVRDMQTGIQVFYDGTNLETIGGISTCVDASYPADGVKNHHYQMHLEPGYLVIVSDHMRYYAPLNEYTPMDDIIISLTLNETWQIAQAYISEFDVTGYVDPTIRGDVNKDTVLQEDDQEALKKHLIDEEKVDFVSADVNRQGTNDVCDLINLVKLLNEQSINSVPTSFVADFTTTDGWSGETEFIDPEKGFGADDGWAETTATITTNSKFNFGEGVEATFTMYTEQGNLAGNVMTQGNNYSIVIGDFEIFLRKFQTEIRVNYKGQQI